MRAALVVLALAAAAACAPAARGGAQPEAWVGTVAVVGSAPMNVRLSFRPDSGPALWLEGPAADELRRLAGARLEVRGRVDRGVLHAEGYRVLSIDGRPAQVGVVENAPGGGLQLRLDDGQVVLLRGAVDAFRPGQKVWVQGPPSVQVQSYGVIAP